MSPSTRRAILKIDDNVGSAIDHCDLTEAEIDAWHELVSLARRAERAAATIARLPKGRG